jgi:deoxyribodipyrimidine photolyase
MPINERTGGTAREVFMANALDGLNSTLRGNLALGLVDVDIDVNINSDMDVEADTDMNTKMRFSKASASAKELISICHNVNAKEVYYLKTHDETEEKDIETILKENGIEPRPYGGAFSLIDYSTRTVPWKDIVMGHPWRSPLIPFVDYVKKVMDEEGTKEGVSITENELEKAVADLSGNAAQIMSLPYRVEDLVRDVGKTAGGTQWGKSIAASWPTKEGEGKRALSAFLESLDVKDDEMKRTHLASRLSPYLARGLLSPQQVYNGILSVGDDADVDSFVRRICWRDYTYAVVNLYPDVTSGRSIRNGYESMDGGTQMDSNERKKRLQSWKSGSTGFPLVDAGMRQLQVEGWMPQKVRLVCSTFLVEGLGLPWRDGMNHFAEFLVDFDVAINSNMWQNAGCVGLDPYYIGMNYKRRMYWDNSGDYVRRWCPELANLPDAVGIQLEKTTNTVDCLYEPWATPPDVLKQAGVTLGVNYPHKVCDDRVSRSLFFSEVREMRSKWPSNLIDDKKRDLVSMGSDDISIGLFTPRALQIRKPR